MKYEFGNIQYIMQNRLFKQRLKFKSGGESTPHPSNLQNYEYKETEINNLTDFHNLNRKQIRVKTPPKLTLKLPY